MSENSELPHGITAETGHFACFGEAQTAWRSKGFRAEADDIAMYLIFQRKRRDADIAATARAAPGTASVENALVLI